jgi:hypothetical protein
MLQTVIEAPDIIRDAERAGLSAEERGKVVALTAAFPKSGADIPGTGGARKIRFAGQRQKRGVPGDLILRRPGCAGVPAERLC